jgi:predicted esterase
MESKIVELEQTVAIPQQALHVGAGRDKPLLLLAHGFSDSGASFFRRIATAIPEKFEVLAPNGLFPQPVRQNGTWKEAWAWYFADLAAKNVYIHPDVSAIAVANLVSTLGLDGRPKVLCGFSQGGWFLPYLAKRLNLVERMLMVGSGFRAEDFEHLGLRLPVSAVHGSEDEVVPAVRSKNEHKTLGASNLGGSFYLVPGMTHSIDDNGRNRLRELLEGEL